MSGGFEISILGDSVSVEKLMSFVEEVASVWISASVGVSVDSLRLSLFFSKIVFNNCVALGFKIVSKSRLGD